MSLAMACITEPHRLNEPEGRGHEILKIWSLYRRGGERSHSPNVKGFLPEPLDKAHDGEPEWCVKVDNALADIIQLERVGIYYDDIIKRFYLGNQAIWDIAEKMHRTEGFVLLSLRGICHHIEIRIPGLDVRG